jgi:hypothetical protein
MGDLNQLNWVARNKDLIKGPILEVGARHYGSSVSVSYRSICPSLEFVGVDMSAGENVDIVVDFTADIDEVSRRLNGRRFGTVICCSVLEHVDQASTACANILNILEPGGTIFISVPFNWRFHGYPSDYWRFTSRGVHQLFEGVAWHDERCTVSSNAIGDEAPLTADVNQFAVVQLHSGPRSPLARAARRARMSLMPKRLRRYPYVLIPTMLNLVGTHTS